MATPRTDADVLRCNGSASGSLVGAALARDLEQELAQAATEIDRLEALVLERDKLNVQTFSERNTAEAALAAAEKRIGAMEGVLEWYALIGNWENDMVEAAGVPVNVPFSAPVFGDVGERARDALAAIDSAKGAKT